MDTFPTEFWNYADDLGGMQGQPLDTMKRVCALATALLNGAPATMFISQHADEGGAPVFDGVLYLAADALVFAEAERDGATFTTATLMSLKHQVRKLTIQTNRIYLDNSEPTPRTTLHLDLAFANGEPLKLNATYKNCTHLKRITDTYFTPNLTRGMPS